MKKHLILIISIGLFASNVFAQVNTAQKPLVRATQTQAPSFEDPIIIRLSREGNLKELRILLAQAFHLNRNTDQISALLQQRDKHGNNALHVAASAEVFDFLAKAAGNMKEERLSQKNQAGETPWMAWLTYDKAALFMKRFPSSSLRQKLESVREELKTTGANLMVAEIKKNALLQECSAGGQTMWQRADALWRMAPAGSKEKQIFFVLRNMIGQAAPFLVR